MWRATPSVDPQNVAVIMLANNKTDYWETQYDFLVYFSIQYDGLDIIPRAGAAIVLPMSMQTFCARANKYNCGFSLSWWSRQIHNKGSRTWNSAPPPAPKLTLFNFLTKLDRRLTKTIFLHFENRSMKIYIIHILKTVWWAVIGKERARGTYPHAVSGREITGLIWGGKRQSQRSEGI